MKQGSLVRVLSGKFKGAAGVVREVRETGRVGVHIEGVHNGRHVNQTVTLQAAQVEVYAHG